MIKSLLSCQVFLGHDSTLGHDLRSLLNKREFPARQEDGRQFSKDSSTNTIQNYYSKTFSTIICDGIKNFICISITQHAQEICVHIFSYASDAVTPFHRDHYKTTQVCAQRETERIKFSLKSTDCLLPLQLASQPHGIRGPARLEGMIHKDHQVPTPCCCRTN